MAQDEITIKTLSDTDRISVGYSDDDIVIIDNIKTLVEPSSARLKMNLIAICTNGKVQVRLNDIPMILGANQLLICPPNGVFSDFMVSPDFEFKALFITNRMLQSFLREKMSVWMETMYVHKTHVISLDGQDTDFYDHFYEMLRLCVKTPKENPFRVEMVQSLLRTAFLGLCGMLHQMLPTVGQNMGRQGDGLFQRFLTVLGNSKVKHRTVESYASELCISPKYLTVVCKKNSGRTANDWITEHVMEDIRYYLRQTDLSIKQVCDQMGFPNASFFGKYVKEHFGMTPVQFRRN